ncbi:hypothetical protein KOAAANKH_02814 [Brevundimonas sp. NIBR10]|uniref:hypothetical protein n=1 Tax=Brevundimonas sp. NIBR10 TaxID=3015997 RepID=UPI0022F1CDAE|nr:hypothetical protein [Brevundimonas sp. NIBR10]WGM47928.1 hypothetical protein KOAAANKH_02814 [Brevundimonas sp. NIBR10]
MPTLLLSRGRASDVDRVSFQSVLADRLRRMGPMTFTIIGLVTFLLALVVTMPAAMLFKLAGMNAPDAVGTIWKGEAAIGDQTAVSWRVRPVSSLLRFGIVSDVQMRGGTTDLVATGLWRPGAVRLEEMSGLAGPGLTDTLTGDLPIRCDLTFVVDMDRIVLAGRRSGAEGRVRSGPGSCSARDLVGAGSLPVPAMTGQSTMDVNGTSAWLSSSSAQGRLAQLTIDRQGRLKVTVLDAGAAILPALIGRPVMESQL